MSAPPPPEPLRPLLPCRKLTLPSSHSLISQFLCILACHTRLPPSCMLVLNGGEPLQLVEVRAWSRSWLEAALLASSKQVHFSKFALHDDADVGILADVAGSHLSKLLNVALYLGVGVTAEGLELLAQVLAAFEAESFTAPRLQAISSSLRSHGIAPSRAIAQLERTMNWLESSDNWFVRLLDLFVFWTPFCILAMERWRRRHGAQVRAWLTAVGDFEALCSLAAFSFERPDTGFPSFLPQGPSLQASALIHPLLPPRRAVANDIALDAAHALIIVSGPNMAGKSTLLRAIGLNIVLAQCGAPVCARSLQMSPLALGASITVQDSLQSGLSRFYAEIQRLKQIDDLARGPHPALFLLDELLSGTNSHDRRVGTEALLRGLLAHNACGMVTTHDLALTEIVAGLNGRAGNMHFGDQFLEGKLHFDYRLAPGIANSTNALDLMRAVGLDV